MKTNLIEFPRAFAFAIDDLGWNEGSDLSINNPSGPFRTGAKRKFDIKDYQHIVAVGKAIGVRIQCSFILSEMDRENVLAKYPTTTYQREKWNNSRLVCDEQIHIMNYVIQEAANMEFGFHGTGHEYWPEEGIQKRAEWYNLIDKEPWPEESLRQHIEGYKEIMAQYGITPENGHSFPESFVPCAYSFYWNPTGDYSLGKLLNEVGVKYANTFFGQIPELNPPQDVNGGGFDHGTHVLNRMNYGNLWYELGTLPKVSLDFQGTDIIESHWNNWLAQDEFLQEEITNRWIQYYKEVQRFPNRYIAKNTEQLHSQWLYNKYTDVSEDISGNIEIDNSNMPEEVYANDTLGNMVLKIKLDTEKHISIALLNNDLIPAYFEEEGFGFIYLPILEKQKYTLKYTIGTEVMPLHVFNDGTFNVYSLKKQGNIVTVLLKMYGTQAIKIKCSKPEEVVSLTNGLTIENYKYESATGMLNIVTNAINMQGTKGEIKILY